MQFEQVHAGAIVVAALSMFLIGGLWYSPVLFGNAWMRANGFTAEALRTSGQVRALVGSAVLALIMSTNLAFFLSGSKATLLWGMTAGLLAGGGWVATGLAMTALFERRSWTYIAINGSYHIVAFTVMGAILGACLSTSAQGVHTTSLVAESKERVLRIEGILPATSNVVWKAFATEEGLKKWMAPVVALDMRVGGTLSTHYDKQASIGSPGTIRLEIVNYLESELITYKVNLNSSFTQKVRAEDRNLQEIIQIVPWTNGTTKVISSMMGWGTGKEWDDTYNFFAKGNARTFEHLVKCFTHE